MTALQDFIDHIEECRNEARDLARSDKLGVLLVSSFTLMQTVLMNGSNAESLPLKVKALSMECESAMRNDPNANDESRALHYGITSCICAVLDSLTRSAEPVRMHACQITEYGPQAKSNERNNTSSLDELHASINASTGIQDEQSDDAQVSHHNMNEKPTRSFTNGGKKSERKQVLEVCTESTDESSNEQEGPQMNEEQQKCLICRVPTKHAHMRIVSCRACAVFFKRTIKMKCCLTCINGDNNCYNGDKITSCRKCRFDRFKYIYDRASADGNTDEDPGHPIIKYSNKFDAPTTANSKDTILNQRTCQLFIDHTSIFNFDLRDSDTPIHDKMKRAYSELSLMRKFGEMSALHHLLMHDQLQEEKMLLRPAKYTDMIPFSELFQKGVMDLAKAVFADFTGFSADKQLYLVKSNFQLIQAIDGSYRGIHNFPNDNTVMATYATYVSDESLPHFLDDCPYHLDKDEAVRLFRQNMIVTTKNAKQEMRKLNPSIEEFTALFLLSLWNDYAFKLDPEMSIIVHRNRQAILRELKTVYLRSGITEYAPRMGQLLFLLSNEERVVDLTNEHVKIYRKMNLFNEAYEDEIVRH